MACILLGGALKLLHIRCLKTFLNLYKNDDVHSLIAEGVSKMSASNKLIFSLAQNLDIDEKNQACKNIGAIRGYNVNTITGSHQISQSEAQTGTMTFSVFNSGIKGVMLYNVGIEVPASANLSQNVYPVQVKLNFTFEGGGTSYATVATGVLCRTGNDRAWDLYVNFFYDFDHHNRAITALKMTVDWGELTIPQSTEITSVHPSSRSFCSAAEFSPYPSSFRSGMYQPQSTPQPHR